MYAKSVSLTLPWVFMSKSKKQFSTVSPTVNKFPRITLIPLATHAVQKSAISPGRSSTCILISVAFSTSLSSKSTPCTLRSLDTNVSSRSSSAKGPYFSVSSGSSSVTASSAACLFSGFFRTMSSNS